MRWIKIRYPASLVILVLLSSILANFDLNTSQNGSREILSENHKIEEINHINPFSEIYSPMQHDDQVNSVKFSPDGKILASAGSDAAIKLWNLSFGQEIEVSPFRHSNKITSLVFSPDGQSIIATDQDGSIVFWNSSSRQVIQNYTSITSGYFISPLAISPTGDQLALRGVTFLRLIDISFGESFYLNLTSEVTLPYGSGPTCMVFAPNAPILVSGHSAGNFPLKIWNSSSGVLIENLPQEDSVYAVDFSPDGQLLASGGRDGKITLWDMNSRENIRNYNGDGGIVNDVAFSPDGKILASCSAGETTIRLWNVTDETPIRTLNGHTASVSSLDFSPDGTLLASGSGDNTTRVWNVVQGVELQALSKHTKSVNTLSFSATGETLISGGDDPEVLLWDLLTLTSIPYYSDHNGSINSVDISSDDTMFATGCADSNVFVYDKSTRTQRYNLKNHSGPVFAVAFSKDNTLLASAGADSNITLWNLTNGERQTFSNHNDTVTSLDFSPDGQLLASGSEDRTIRLWNVSSGIELSVSPLIGHDYPVNTIAFSPVDPTILVSGSKGIETNIIVWDILQGKPKINLSGHTLEVLSVTFSPEGNIFATSSYDGTISFWDTFTGECYFTSPKEPDPIYSICYSPQHGVFASTQLTDIILWNMSDGQVPTDFDNDGMPDSWELSVGLDHGNFWNKFLDTDNDGLINSLEYFLTTNVTIRDSDLDNMPDGWEYLMGLDPLIDDSQDDLDGDGMPNLWEYRMKLHPSFNDAMADLDHDGMPNIWEYQNGFNATDPSDAASDPDG
ncbi:MAG: hypothetical protein ACFFDC_15025, partial [Promethearchaeota archaeon]